MKTYKVVYGNGSEASVEAFSASEAERLAYEVLYAIVPPADAMGVSVVSVEVEGE